MVIHIANKKVDGMVRKLAADRGITLVDTVHQCVEEALRELDRQRNVHVREEDAASTLSAKDLR